MSVDEAQVRAAAEAVTDPELRRSLGELGMVRSVSVKRKRVTVDLAVPVGQYPQVEDLVGRVREAVGALAGVDEVGGEVGVMTEDERRRVRLLLRGEPLDGGVSAYADENGHDHGGHRHDQGGQLGHEEGRPNRFMLPRSRTRVIGISSGKGGVGKSSVTVNLAVALAQQGHDVGILDADVYGFSVPKMLGVRTDPLIIDDLVIPPIVHGVRCLSMGFFVPDETPVIWRGPMLHKALEQFLVDAYWGEPDFLLVDMPPGTGDVTLSLGQYLTKTEVFVVTTPQAAAQRVAQRSAYAARKLKLAVRGVIENMSWFTGDDGARYELFGSGGGKSLAHELGVPLMAQIPLVPALRHGGDVGEPVMVADPDGEAATAFTRLAEQMVGLGPARVYRQELTVH
ncbi:MAG TPA: Mrp/NBP35 family ATP-binding protein [Acidimicrobiales bacterium]|jgi:ATP-binding protein involved in chromosome partitioning|nr:Mrp/NBP35 family ATP-binding protein [Acidimicrobiales bacterium]